jgi:putative glutathione S-transferase
MLIDGKWSDEAWHPYQSADDIGRFQRKPATFRNWITPTGEAGPTGNAGFVAEPGRYHLYVALICPWASRTLMVRKLKKLDDVISVSIVEPFLTEQSWKFGNSPGATGDEINNATYLHEIYTASDSHFTGRVTVPVLWDKHQGVIVNNESADIMRMLNTAFDAYGETGVDLYPVYLRAEIDRLNDDIYDNFNNGVYRAGFAQSQGAYEEAINAVFTILDMLEGRLDGQNFLLGDEITEVDIRAFVTLVRFDAAYFNLFKCNIKSIADYPNLPGYLGRILDIPGIRETVNIDHIKNGYYSLKAINPTGIVPVGPNLEYLG